MHTLIQDLRFGARMLLKKPGFTFVAVVTLALGVGANTAIFSVVNAVLLRPLPFKDSDRVVLAWNKGAEAAGGDRTPLALSELLDWRSQTQTFESVAAFQHRFFNYTGGSGPERVRSVGVTTNFFETLGINPSFGRTFSPDEEKPGAPRVVIISDGFWRRHFSADQQAIGQAITLNEVSFSIVGIMPAGVNFPAKDVELWTAMQITPPTRWGPWFLTGIARLKPGVSISQAHAELQTLKRTFGGDFDLNILSINDHLVGNVRPALLAMLVAVTLVLLIAASNVANLSLVRASARVKEISIRSALGASQWRIIRQLLTESVLLAVAGGAIGAFCASWSVELLRTFGPEEIPRLDQVSVDGRVLGWTVLVSLATGVIFGLAPALQSAKLNLNEILKEGGRSSTEGAGRRRWRNVLVGAELALAVMLLIGAGLLVKSLWRLQQVDLGVDPDRVLTMQLGLRGQRYAQNQQVTAFCSRVLEQVSALPGVRAAAVSDCLPPDQNAGSSDYKVEGRSYADNEPPIAYYVRTSPDYFRAMGTRLRSGRYFTDADSADAPPVILINETLQRLVFTGEDPVGRRMNVGSDSQPNWVQIVGVIGDVKYNGLADVVQPALYLPIAQNPMRSLSLIVKTETADPSSLTAMLREEISKLDPEMPIAQINTMEERLATALAQPRFRTWLIALFALIALALACIGIYGVMSYSVTQRTHEIGVRMALGAQARDVQRMVIKQGLTVIAAGVLIGLAASLGLTRLMSSLLFGVAATDLWTYMATASLLALTALIACYLPARRATKVDPMEALRYE